MCAAFTNAHARSIDTVYVPFKINADIDKKQNWKLRETTTRSVRRRLLLTDFII